MKTTIPTRQTKIPSREGLTLHEIIADGLIHAAHVFDITDDERFVERVLSIAWVNAARLVQSNFWQAASLAGDLSTETHWRVVATIASGTFTFAAFFGVV